MSIVVSRRAPCVQTSVTQGLFLSESPNGWLRSVELSLISGRLVVLCLVMFSLSVARGMEGAYHWFTIKSFHDTEVKKKAYRQ